MLAAQHYPQTSPVPGEQPLWFSRVRGARLQDPAQGAAKSLMLLRRGLRDERTDIRTSLPLGETQRRGFGIPPYGGILLALWIAYVVPIAGAFESVGGEK